MCIRYTLKRPAPADVGRALGAEVVAGDARYAPRNSIVPGDTAWIVTTAGDRLVLRVARWNYLTRAKRSLSTIPSEVIRFGRFRDAFATRRCAIIADTISHWPEGSPGPIWYRSSHADLVLMGGLFQPPRVTGTPGRVSVLTARARLPTSEKEGRMPVLVGMCELDRWLNADLASALAMVQAPDRRHMVRTED